MTTNLSTPSTLSCSTISCKPLLRGEEVELPRFNFTLGKKEYKGDKLRIDKHTILILEGIHALNPELTPANIRRG